MTMKEDFSAAPEEERDIPIATGTPIPASSSAPAPAAESRGTTSTTTTYTIPPPSAHQGAVLQSLGRRPCPITCPYCHAQTHTLPQNSPDCCTIIIFIVLLVVFWPICWLPFVLPDCQKTEHQCAACMRHVGTTESCAN